jgi:hypothetical protein
MYTAVQNKIRTTQTQEGNCSMCKLSKKWEHQKLLPPQTEMREMRKAMPPKRKIE